MADLKQIQGDFAKRIMMQNHSGIEKHIKPNTTISAQSRLCIYQNTSRLILIENLQSIFPICTALMGHVLAEKTYERFIKEFPPKTGDMSFYGAEMPNFILHDDIPYLQDMAQFEWQFYLCYFAPIHSSMTINDFSKKAPEQLLSSHLKLQEHLHFVPPSPFPLDEIWQWHQGDQEQQLTLPKRGAHLICFRDGRDIHYWNLPKGAYLFLQNCKNGKTYQEAAEQGLENDPECDILSYIGQFTQKGFFTDLQEPSKA